MHVLLLHCHLGKVDFNDITVYLQYVVSAANFTTIPCHFLPLAHLLKLWLLNGITFADNTRQLLVKVVVVFIVWISVACSNWVR